MGEAFHSVRDGDKGSGVEGAANNPITALTKQIVCPVWGRSPHRCGWRQAWGRRSPWFAVIRHLGVPGPGQASVGHWGVLTLSCRDQDAKLKDLLRFPW